MHFHFDDDTVSVARWAILGDAPWTPSGDAEADTLTAIAHELRTPLTTIRSVSEILGDNPDMPAPQRETFLAMLAEETERLNATVERMLSASTAGPDRWCVDMENLSRGAETP